MTTLIKEKCKCGSENITVQGWAKKTNPNEYRLFDKHICRDCKLIRIVELAEIDKNTDETRRTISGEKTETQKFLEKHHPKADEIDVNSIKF